MTLPYSFSAGQKAKAAEVNADFVFLKDTITQTASALQANVNSVQNALDTTNTALAKVIPTGTILWLAFTTVPTGFLYCNGGAISRITYADLFAAIGVTFGAGDSSTTFNLPNLVDRYIKGSGTVGTVLAAGLPNITGNWTYDDRWGSAASGAIQQNSSSYWDFSAGGAASYSKNVSFNASLSSSIYGSVNNTVQPPSLTLKPCIKY